MAYLQETPPNMSIAHPQETVMEVGAFVVEVEAVVVEVAHQKMAQAVEEDTMMTGVQVAEGVGAVVPAAAAGGGAVPAKASKAAKLAGVEAQDARAQATSAGVVPPLVDSLVEALRVRATLMEATESSARRTRWMPPLALVPCEHSLARCDLHR